MDSGGRAAAVVVFLSSRGQERRGRDGVRSCPTHGLSLAPLWLLLLNEERLVPQKRVSPPPPALAVPFAAHIEASLSPLSEAISSCQCEMG